ncbi:MAG: hypothetical protein JW839_20315 [Candidatus Lokiarchaeota archaeon]|nr:hypothetical protein [Candidatus Lokiarchaeota archaeon]
MTEADLSTLESILKRNGPADALPVIRKLLDQGAGAPAFDAAVGAIRGILDAGDDHDKRGEALIEPMTIGLEDADPQTRKHASNALGLLRVATQPPPRTIAALGACLAQWESFPEAAHNSASALWGMALSSHDISLAIDPMRTALGSADHWTREAAAEALSEHYRRTGAEPPIRPDYHALPPPRMMGGRWELSVRYRRTHATADAPVDLAHPDFRCAACLSDRTSCIWYEEVLGTCYTFVTAEILCKKCGKYSVFEYED